MTYELSDKELENLNQKLLKAFKKGVDAIKEEIMSFLEEKVPYE